jgi:hypothetical protein
MKAIFSSLVALSLAAALAGHADAASQQQKRRLEAGNYDNSYPATSRGNRQPAPSDGASDYYQHLLGKVPFGSKQWWSVYDEQHGPPN